jgi:hypothetical protein
MTRPGRRGSEPRKVIATRPTRGAGTGIAGSREAATTRFLGVTEVNRGGAGPTRACPASRPIIVWFKPRSRNDQIGLGVVADRPLIRRTWLACAAYSRIAETRTFSRVSGYTGARWVPIVPFSGRRRNYRPDPFGVRLRMKAIIRPLATWLTPRQSPGASRGST